MYTSLLASSINDGKKRERTYASLVTANDDDDDRGSSCVRRFGVRTAEGDGEKKGTKKKPPVLLSYVYNMGVSGGDRKRARGNSAR